jgi:hypothetical protein
MARKFKLKIYDALGQLWIYDGKRVYLELADDGIIYGGTIQNGTYIKSAKQALVTLAENGYMEKVENV